MPIDYGQSLRGVRGQQAHHTVLGLAWTWHCTHDALALETAMYRASRSWRCCPAPTGQGFHSTFHLQHALESPLV